MRIRSTMHIALLLSAIVALPGLAVAALPAHAPGTLCATPKFWCRAPARGAVGARCSCPSPSGWIVGALV